MTYFVCHTQVLAALLLDVRLWAAAPAHVQQNLFALCLKLAQVNIFRLKTSMMRRFVSEFYQRWRPCKF